MWLQFRGSLTRQKANARSTRETGHLLWFLSTKSHQLHFNMDLESKALPFKDKEKNSRIGKFYINGFWKVRLHLNARVTTANQYKDAGISLPLKWSLIPPVSLSQMLRRGNTDHIRHGLGGTFRDYYFLGKKDILRGGFSGGVCGQFHQWASQRSNGDCKHTKAIEAHTRKLVQLNTFARNMAHALEAQVFIFGQSFSYPKIWKCFLRAFLPRA